MSLIDKNKLHEIAKNHYNKKIKQFESENKQICIQIQEALEQCVTNGYETCDLKNIIEGTTLEFRLQLFDYLKDMGLYYITEKVKTPDGYCHSVMNIKIILNEFYKNL